MKDAPVMKRDLRPEKMDNPNLDPKLHTQALRGLDRLNFLSRTIPPLWKPIKELAKKNNRTALRVLDLATGGGGIPISIKQRAELHRIRLSAEGCDLSLQALVYARKKAKDQNTGVFFSKLDIFKDEIPPKYDVMTNALFLHHLSEDQVVAFLKRMKESVLRMIVISDLERSRLGLFLAWATSYLVSRSPIVHFDAAQSVRAAFTLEEMKNLVKRAGLEGAEIKRIWPCRFRIIWQKK